MLLTASEVATSARPVVKETSEISEWLKRGQVRKMQIPGVFMEI